jgi:hypothetical protein
LPLSDLVSERLRASFMHKRTCCLVTFATAFAAASVSAQTPQPPAYETGAGPKVFIDEAHNNLHTKDGQYAPFANLLSSDGYVVDSLKEPFSDDILKNVEILVISNALRELQQSAMRLPTVSAFSDAEIEAAYRWVSSGGSLLLIADHMPWAGAAEKLAMRFGVFINNGYAATPGSSNPLTFNQTDGSLRDHPIVRGRNEMENVPFVATFGGSAFRLRAELDATPLMVFRSGSIVLLTEELLTEQIKVTPQTPRIPAEGMLQGVAMVVGEGRVVVSGEAAMFSAQVAPGGQPYGFNSPDARHNTQFVLNVMHWLSGVL